MTQSTPSDMANVSLPHRGLSDSIEHGICLGTSSDLIKDGIHCMTKCLIGPHWITSYMLYFKRHHRTHLNTVGRHRACCMHDYTIIEPHEIWYIYNNYLVGLPQTGCTYNYPIEAYRKWYVSIYSIRRYPTTSDLIGEAYLQLPHRSPSNSVHIQLPYQILLNMVCLATP